MAIRNGKHVESVAMGVFNPKKVYTWIKIHVAPLFKSGEDTPYQVYTVFDDITEYKRIDEALRISEQRWYAILVENSDLVILHDVKGFPQ